MEDTQKFVHLHVHTHYSMLDGACRVGDLVKRAKALNMPAIAITDHGAMHGVIEFYNECKKEGIKPIIGMEAYMAPGDRRERTTHGGNAGDAAYHLLLLAENLEGYRNLIKLSSIAYREGFYYKPRIDKEVLREFSKGLIASSACLGGEVCSAFMKRDSKAARTVAETYVDIFGPDRFYIEVQKQGIKEQDMVNPELEDLATKLGVGLIATNDVHFLNKDDHHAHDVLCCISMGKLVNDENRLKYPTELYLKSPAEMKAGCGQFDQAMENTVRIAEMCNLELEFGKKYAPVYRVPTEKLQKETPHIHAGLRDDERYLRQLCEEGLTWRYGTTDVSKEIRDRLEYELKIICMKNFCSYFLIVWDFCNYARDNGIPVGARGSGVGTMVGYLLGLCNVDPLKYNLLFERFMDPSRNEMPDIDIDICQDGRQKIIDYVREKYGHVAQIITFGTLAAKAACKDVGRVMGVSLADVDKITKLIPGTPGMTLKKAMESSPDLQKMYDDDPQTHRIIDVAQKLEGLCRNAGCHAAGVIIADQPLDNLVPLYRDSDGNILTQFEGPIAEKVGLLKMDFLGLRTLSTLTRAVELEKQTRSLRGAPEKEKGVPYDAQGRVDIEAIDFSDPKVLALFSRGESRGIFQFESGGMTDLLMKMQPDRLEDLIAANALYRPGPMELIPLYCNRKHKREVVPQVHPIMDKILAETYGIMCIHEDTRISLANGIEKPIKFVRRGDRVHSLNYRTRRFEIKECHGCGPTRRGEGVQITLENGFSVTLTPDHKVLTYTGLKEACALDLENDLIAAGVELAQESPSYAGIAPWLGSDQDVAYLLGSYLGDGCLNKSGIIIATGRQQDHDSFVRWLNTRLPSLRVHGYFHGRCWYVSLSHPQLLNLPGHGNRKTRLHHFLETHGLKVRAGKKSVPDFIFHCDSPTRAAFLAGLLDADGCTAVSSEGAAICFLSSTSAKMLQDVRRLTQMDGIPATIRKNRIQFWNLQKLSTLLNPFLLVRCFKGKLTQGATVGWVPRSAVVDAIPAEESLRAFSSRTGIMRAGLNYDFPFCKSSTASKAGIDLGNIRYFRITKIERVADQQFYGMSVADHHNLVANGIVVKNCYQEQVMQVFNQLGGIELSNAYKLIKAISKKTSDVIAKFKPDFLKGAMANGISKDKAEEIFELILKFGGYGFNKSHSTRYAIIAYQTAYMKTYHPVEYMAALLTFEMGSTDKVVEYIEECKRMTVLDGTRGVRVLPPDVNVSNVDFTPIYDQDSPKRKRKSGVIRFGLAAVKGVGEKAVETIIAGRGTGGVFRSIYEFCERVDLRAVNRSTIEALIKCGAFDSLGSKRSQLLAVLDKAVEMGAQMQQDRRMGQLNMFGVSAATAATSRTPETLPPMDEFPQADLLKNEKEVLGFYITSHPLTEHQSALDRYGSHTTRQALHLSDGNEVIIGGLVAAVKKRITKNGRSAGQQMAIVTLEDLEGQIECMVFAETLADLNRRGDLLAPESIVFIKGKIDKRRESPSIVVNDVLPLPEAISKMTTAMLLKLDRSKHSLQMLAELKPVLKAHGGRIPLYAQVSVESGLATVVLPAQWGIKPSDQLISDVDRLLGSGTAQLIGPGTKRRIQQQKLFKESQVEDAPVEASDAMEPELVAAMDE